MENKKTVKLNSKKNRLKQKSKTEKVVFTAVFIFFATYSILLLLPFCYGFTIALKENGRAFMKEPVAITFPLYFKNFLYAFEALKINEENTFWTMIVNSVWYSIGMSVISIFSSTCVAYVVAKYQFRGGKFIYALTLIVMMIPIYGALPAQYKLYDALNFIDSPLILITAIGGFNANFIYIYSFFKGFSWDYAEAAFVDGAGNFKVFFTIALPMMLPSVSALFIMAFIGNWNDYATPLLWLPNMLPLATGLYKYDFNMQFEANQPLYFAGVFLSLLPVVALFICFQNTIMSSVYSGGLKG